MNLLKMILISELHSFGLLVEEKVFMREVQVVALQQSFTG